MSKITENTTNLQEILDTVNGLPEGGNSGGVKFPNGTEWTQSNVTDVEFICVYYANGIWVAGTGNSDGLYYSVTWEPT